jgi:hypothetical protein
MKLAIASKDFCELHLYCFGASWKKVRAALVLAGKKRPTQSLKQEEKRLEDEDNFFYFFFFTGFNMPISNLPTTLTHITFGENFNQPVTHLLPPSLTHLTFGNMFNSAANYLPDKLTHLTFGAMYNLPGILKMNNF